MTFIICYDKMIVIKRKKKDNNEANKYRNREFQRIDR